MSIARLAAIVGVVVALAAGCGGSGSDEAEVEGTVRAYLQAFAAGNGEEACSQLTGAQARSLFAEAVILLPELRITSCSDAVQKLAGSLGGPEREALDGAQIDAVKIDGDTATATIKGATQTARLTRESDGWFISGGLELSP